MPAGGTMSPSNPDSVHSIISPSTIPCMCQTQCDTAADSASCSSLVQGQQSHVGCNSSDSRRAETQTVPTEIREELIDEADIQRVRLANSAQGQPCLVVSSYISPNRTPTSELATSHPVGNSYYTPSSSRYLSASPSASSLCSSPRTIAMPSSLSTTAGVTRSTSAYTYPSIQLPIPPRSPGLTPVTRISFSTDVGSSLNSSVAESFGEPHFPEGVSTTFDSSEVRLESPVRNINGEVFALQEGASGLMVSLNNISNVPGPPLYSPPPTYEQVGKQKLSYRYIIAITYFVYIKFPQFSN